MHRPAAFPRTPVARLSAREREVLALMAEGRSNAAIAEGLAVREKTVETHVANLFAKLGLVPEPSDNRRVLAVLTHLRALGATGTAPGSPSGRR